MNKSVCFNNGLEDFLRQLDIVKSKWRPYTQKLFDHLVEILKNQNRYTGRLNTQIHLKMKDKEEFSYFAVYWRKREQNIKALKTIYNVFFEDIPFEMECENHGMLARILSSIFIWENEFYVDFSPVVASAILQKEGVKQ